MTDDSANIQTLRLPDPVLLDCGQDFGPIDVAYDTLGTLNSDKSNAILVCHALTGDQFCGSPNTVTGRPAWWDRIVGPGLPVDTDRFFVISTNVLGGCMGTTGPASLDENSIPYGLRFPVITIGDMVRTQRAFIAELGIPSLFCVIGGSMGGMQALEWAVQAPDQVFSAIPIAACARSSAQNIAFYAVGRQAIMSDPDWKQGRYLEEGTTPKSGFAVARMAASITYVSEHSLKRKFDRDLQDREATSFSFDSDFQIESWLRHVGQSFTDRFDANSYLYVTRAMDYFDLAARFDGRLASPFQGSKTRYAVFSFSSDWHYPPEDSREITRALIAAGAEVSHMEIETDQGHDAFFLEEPSFSAALTGFIDASAKMRGL